MVISWYYIQYSHCEIVSGTFRRHIITHSNRMKNIKVMIKLLQNISTTFVFLSLWNESEKNKIIEKTEPWIMHYFKYIYLQQYRPYWRICIARITNKKNNHSDFLESVPIQILFWKTNQNYSQKLDQNPDCSLNHTCNLRQSLTTPPWSA